MKDDGKKVLGVIFFATFALILITCIGLPHTMEVQHWYQYILKGLLIIIKATLIGGIVGVLMMTACAYFFDALTWSAKHWLAFDGKCIDRAGGGSWRPGKLRLCKAEATEEQTQTKGEGGEPQSDTAPSPTG